MHCDAWESSATSSQYQGSVSRLQPSKQGAPTALRGHAFCLNQNWLPKQEEGNCSIKNKHLISKSEPVNIPPKPQTAPRLLMAVQSPQVLRSKPWHYPNSLSFRPHLQSMGKSHRLCLQHRPRIQPLPITVCLALPNHCHLTWTSPMTSNLVSPFWPSSLFDPECSP